MGKSRFTESQISKILREVEVVDRLVKKVCRDYGIWDGTYYNWKENGGTGVSDIKQCG